MNPKKGVGGLIRLLKFDNDEPLDPKSLFEGAKLTMKSSMARKPSFSDRCTYQPQPAQYEPVDGQERHAEFSKQRARRARRGAQATESEPLDAPQRARESRAFGRQAPTQLQRAGEGGWRRRDVEAEVPVSLVPQLASQARAVLRGQPRKRPER